MLGELVTDHAKVAEPARPLRHGLAGSPTGSGCLKLLGVMKGVKPPLSFFLLSAIFAPPIPVTLRISRRVSWLDSATPLSLRAEL